MNERIAQLRDQIRQGAHRRLRRRLSTAEVARLQAELAELSPVQRIAHRTAFLLDLEVPAIPGETILLTRTLIDIPPAWSPEEETVLHKGRFVHELGRVFNITSDFSTTLRDGLLQRRLLAERRLARCLTEQDEEGIEFCRAVIKVIDAIVRLARRYAEVARTEGLAKEAAILELVPAHGCRTFREALQSLRFLHYALWMEGHYHCGLGRFDQYMMPYLQADLDAGRLDVAGALEAVEEFFISLNKDSDLYPGVQQGDNGQTMVLGGCDIHGCNAENLLTQICLTASRKLMLIDPKINLRVSRNTSMELLKQATLLTREGLGFPQYCNDDTIIPALTAKGYSLTDARDYVVAACWEVIIPGVGMDVPNIGAVSLLKAVEQAVVHHLHTRATFRDLMVLVKTNIHAQAQEIACTTTMLYMEPGPFQSVLMNGCIENARDISTGLRYNNYGMHATGLANAVDSLAAVQELVYSRQAISAATLQQAMAKGFAKHPKLLGQIKALGLHLGNDDPVTNGIAAEIAAMVWDAAATLRNDRGGCFRVGFGSAMYYITHGQEVGATPDGRDIGAPLSANLAPALGARTAGPLSVIKAFTRLDTHAVMNGGPLTLEFDNNIFRSDEGAEKMAALIHAFIHLGGYQLQLNTVRLEKMLAAQQHPELHADLIVRVWGWSGYFVELDKMYQDHIIARQAYAV